MEREVKPGQVYRHFKGTTHIKELLIKLFV